MFEISATDLLARVGSLETSKGVINTPCFVPVVHPEPSKNLIDVAQFQEQFNVDFIITSSYILRKRFDDTITNLHELTKFEGPIMTDSGAFQSLVYGEIELTPESVIKFQEGIGSDFAVPLDIPISISDSYEIAADKVDTTITRSLELPKLVSSRDTQWVAPIQGGKFIDLVSKSAQALSQSDFYSLYAIGSVVEIMNNYQYDILMDIIFTAKQYLDPKKPIHLFGAGHPSMFPFIVAAGCDSFDSAAYALYAQEDRYLTNTQTLHLEDLDVFPCNCSICSNYTPEQIRSLPKSKRMTLLATHNLIVCQTEINIIKKAISSGSLWNLLERRSRAHPYLRRGFQSLLKYSSLLVPNSPSTKKRGIFFVSETDKYRPEIQLHLKRLQQMDFDNSKALIVLSLLNQEIDELYHIFTRVKSIIRNEPMLEKNFEFWVLTDYFGIIPLEVSEVFPLSQSVIANQTTDISTTNSHLLNAINLIKKNKFTEIYFLGDLSLVLFLQQSQSHCFDYTVKTRGINIKISNSYFRDLEQILHFISKQA